MEASHNTPVYPGGLVSGRARPIRFIPARRQWRAVVGEGGSLGKGGGCMNLQYRVPQKGCQSYQWDIYIPSSILSHMSLC